MDEKLKKYYKWYEETYSKIINLNKLENKIDDMQDKILKTSLKKFEYGVSSIWRHEVLSYIRYYAQIKDTEYICISFKISRVGDSSILKNKMNYYSTIYAIMYATYDEKNNKIIFEYVSSCPTFNSADGEYRHRFLKLDQIFNIYNENKEFFNEIEKYVINQLKNKKIIFDTNYILPNDNLDKNKQKNKKILDLLKKEIEKIRLKLILYMTSWIIDVNRYIEGKLDNHIAIGYKEAMFAYNDEDFYNNLLKKIGIDKYNNIVVNLFRYLKFNDNKYSPLELGQKFIPLTIYDMESMGDAKLAPWREIYSASLVGNLVINGISPTFPIFNDWFLIQGNSPEFWSNSVSKVKFKYSEIASEIVKELEHARKSTYTINPITQKEVYISYNFEGLSKAIDIPMDYAEQEIIFADVILCTITEHVGRTLADTPALMLHETYQITYGPIYKNFSIFSKLMFEYTYGLYCLNIKLGIIQGDLHLNNVTIFIKKSVINPVNKEWYVINPHVIYHIGKSDYYIFPTYGSTACIIDFSRSFIDREHLLKQFGFEMTESIIYHQRIRIMRTLERDLPDFYTAYKEKIEIVLLSDFDTVFKIFMAIDIYKLSKSFSSMINFDILTNKIKLETYADKEVLEESSLPLLTKISNMAYTYITSNLIQLFENKLNKNTLDNLNLLVLKECFKSFNMETYNAPLHNGEKFISIIDYFSAENELLYDCRMYDKFPETVKLDYIIKNKVPTDELGLKNYQEHLEYLRKEALGENIEKIERQIIEDKRKRRGSPEIEEPTKETIKEFKEKEKTIEAHYYNS